MWDFEMECLQLSQLCPFDSSDRMLDEIERSTIIYDSMFTVVLAQREIVN